MPPLKLLLLHGYSQSGPIFSAKTKSLAKTLQKSIPDGVSLHYPTAPIRLRLADLPGQDLPGEGVEESEEVGDSWGWWRKDPEDGRLVGLDETWRFLGDYLETHGPFAGVIGFSQGAALAGLLTCLLDSSPTQKPRPQSFGPTQHPPFSFAVYYSGFRAAVEESFYEPKPKDTRILHFLGSLDTVVSEERSLALVDACGGEVVRHPGGHYLPGGKSFVKVLVGFIRDEGEGEKKKKEEEEVGVEDMEVPF